MMDQEAIDPVLVIPQKRQKLSLTDFEACIFCQKKGNSLSLGSISGIDKVRSTFILRQKYNDPRYSEFLNRISPSIDHLHEKKPKWHVRSCYSRFCNKAQVDLLQKDVTMNEFVSSQDTDISIDSSDTKTVDWEKCILCQQRKNSSFTLHHVTNVDCETKIKILGKTDSTLRTSIEGEDLILNKAKYHSKCKLKRSRVLLKSNHQSHVQENIFDSTFCKLTKMLDVGFAKGHVYNLSGITSYYQKLLVKKGNDGHYTTQHLKERLTKHYSDKISFISQSNKTHSLLVYSNIPTNSAVIATKGAKEDLQNISIAESMVIGEQSDDDFFLRALNIVSAKIRCDLEKTEGHNSYENLNDTSVRKVVPDSLMQLLELILFGSSESESGETEKMKLLSIAQDILFVSSKGKKTTPKHIALGLTIHQTTRSKTLVQLLHASGHCISYDRVQRIDTAIAQRQIERFINNSNTFIPENLVKGKFIHFAGDNIDFLEDTIDGKGTFHGTQIAAFQKGPPAFVCHGNIQNSSSKVLHSIPDEMFRIKSSGYNSSMRTAPKYDNILFDDFTNNDLSHSDLKNLVWLNSRYHCSKNDQQTVPGWTGFNNIMCDSSQPVTTIAPLPIIPSPPTEYDTVWSVIIQCERISKHLGQDKTVITFDEGIYCKAKELAWMKRTECKDIILLLGGFHICMNFLKVIGQHFSGSGLMDVLVESGLYSASTVTNILSGKNWNRAIRCHKLLFEALWRVYWQKFLIWMQKQDESYCEELQFEDCFIEHFKKDSDTDKIQKHMDTFIVLQPLFIKFEEESKVDPTFVYWKQYIEMVQVLLQFIRAEREGLWELHIRSFSKMLPWMAIYDHLNYLKWGAVYLQEMKELITTAPSIYKHFIEGNFVIKQSKGSFNHIAADMALEHINKIGKISGGIVGITQTDTARNRWCLSYSDRSRITENTKVMFGINSDTEFVQPKDAGKSRLVKDEEHVCLLEDQLLRFNVFENCGTDLISISTKDVAPLDVKEALLGAQKAGEIVLQNFINERLSNVATKNFFDRIPKQNTKTFDSMKKKTTCIQKTNINSVRTDREILRSLFLAIEGGRLVDLDNILKYELTALPVSISDRNGCLRHCSKAVLAQILKGTNTTPTLGSFSDMPTCKIIDGMALVQSIGKPSHCKTFGDLADTFVQVVHSHFKEECTRVDVVFDHYKHLSVKADERKKRQTNVYKPIRRKIENSNVPLPKQWPSFLSLLDNKKDLANFFSNEVVANSKDKRIITAGGFHNITSAQASFNLPLDELSSTHEEADTRIILHAKHAVSCGYNRVIVICKDTDVLVLLIHFFKDIGATELWLLTGTKMKPQFIAVHDLYKDMPKNIIKYLPGFHAITGCDTVSQFAGIGKKRAWKIYEANVKLLSKLGSKTFNDTLVENCERFIIKLFSSDSTEMSINALRSTLFRKKPLEGLPPTKGVLLEHIRRAHLQANTWYSSLQPMPNALCPTEYGWSLVNDQMTPLWTKEESAPKYFPQLQSCHCKTKCSKNTCSCKKMSLCCISSCLCYGEGCLNPYNENDSELSS